MRSDQRIICTPALYDHSSAVNACVFFQLQIISRRKTSLVARVDFFKIESKLVSRVK